LIGVAMEGKQMPLLLRTKGACDFDPEHLLHVFGEQRQRFVTLLQWFGPDDWAAPTRCAAWCAQDVVRHLCDTNMRAAAVGPDDRTLDITAGFDPRITPRQWLMASAGEPPVSTLSRFMATTEERLALDRARLAEGRQFDVRLPYGPMDWTVRELHGFWDSWTHERDVLLARGLEHPTNADAIVYATAYGLFIAAAVATVFGDRVQEKLSLGGDGGGVFDLDSRDGVTLTVTRVTAGGPAAAQVADALAGRSPGAEVLGGLPADSRRALMHMARFNNTPVEPRPTAPHRDHPEP
jgi:uncharacterized protein (TIGR03083 family)